MPIKPQAALKLAQAYLDANRSDCQATGLLEDDVDYLVTVATKSGAPFPPGWALVFINKGTGRLWTATPHLGAPRLDSMREVQL